jgi:hypothetical protein
LLLLCDPIRHDHHPTASLPGWCTLAHAVPMRSGCRPVAVKTGSTSTTTWSLGHPFDGWLSEGPKGGHCSSSCIRSRHLFARSTRDTIVSCTTWVELVLDQSLVSHQNLLSRLLLRIFIFVGLLLLLLIWHDLDGNGSYRRVEHLYLLFSQINRWVVWSTWRKDGWWGDVQSWLQTCRPVILLPQLPTVSFLWRWGRRIHPVITIK